MSNQLPLLLDRLLLCNQEIEGVTAFKLPPPEIKSEQLPVIYPLVPDFETQQNAAGFYERVWRFTLEVPVRSIFTDQFTTESEEELPVEEYSAGAAESAELMAAIINYYDAHPRLNTENEDGLGWIVHDILINGQFVPGLRGADDNPYLGLMFTLTITTLAGLIEE